MMQTCYSRLRLSAGATAWHHSAMKNMLVALAVFLIGAGLIHALPGVDLVPDGVRAVLDEVASVW